MTGRHPHADLVDRFYTAFQRRDADGMTACYHPEVEFSDEVFVGLRGERARAMWRMLCARGKDLRVEFRDVEADEVAGRARWEAWYTFSPTKRAVHNVVEARFDFRDGLIARHVDSFDLRRWAGQALGPLGALLAWAPPVQTKIRATAEKSLDDFIARG